MTDGSAQNASSSNKKVILLAVPVVIIIGALVALASRPNNKVAVNESSDQAGASHDETANTPSVNVPANTPSEDTPPAVGGLVSDVAGVKTFKVIGSNFAFSPKEMKVKHGDKVKIIFFNEKGFHDWVLDEFGARTALLKAGETGELEFIASKKGTFEYYCSVGKHREMGMKGNLIVE